MYAGTHRRLPPGLRPALHLAVVMAALVTTACGGGAPATGSDGAPIGALDLRVSTAILTADLDADGVSDVIELRAEQGELVFVRQVFQGKFHTAVSVTGEPPYFASLQSGAFRGDQVRTSADLSPIKQVRVVIEASQIRTKTEAPFREAKTEVDLSGAEIIVSVGRGIRDAEHIELARKLAEALGAELGASRPICDSGWLPLERQVGSSGQTVSPKLYVAIGISGAIQHVVGMKGSQTIVAINKDETAPIFEMADYGIVGDLFEIVPALTDAVLESKQE